MKNLSLSALQCSLAIALSASVLHAQEDAAAEPKEDQAAADGVAAPKAAPALEKPFHLLPLCRLMEGGAEVLRPGAQAWEPLEEGKFYPLGCAYRTTAAGSRLSVQFGIGSEVELVGIASFATRAQPVGLKDRTVILKSGTIKVVLPRNMPSDRFKVTAPGFTAFDLAGESVYEFSGKGDGDEATVRCVTGALAIKGRHFLVKTMHAANEIKIRTSQDMLFTGLYGTSGDYVVELDQGVVQATDVETGANTNEIRKLDWHLSPRTAVRIHRAVPAVGERMSVTVMTFDETGALVNRCAFAEGLPELNTGEQGEKALAEKEEKAKRKLEDADAVTTEAAPDETASTTEENKENETTTEESTEE